MQNVLIVSKIQFSRTPLAVPVESDYQYLKQTAPLRSVEKAPNDNCYWSAILNKSAADPSSRCTVVANIIAEAEIGSSLQKINAI